MPPDAFVYCSINSGDDPKGSTTSEYESPMLRGMRGSSGTTGGETSWWRGAAFNRTSDHGIGGLKGTILQTEELVQCLNVE